MRPGDVRAWYCPNITGWFGNGYRGIVGGVNGAFSISGFAKYRDWGGQGTVSNADGAGINASLSSAVYSSATVQPAAFQTLIIIRA